MADDTTCFISDIYSAQRLFALFKDFEHISGLKANFDKTEARWIGASKGQPNGNLEVAWKTESFYTLGIHFCQTELDEQTEN